MSVLNMHNIIKIYFNNGPKIAGQDGVKFASTIQNTACPNCGKKNLLNEKINMDNNLTTEFNRIEHFQLNNVNVNDDDNKSALIILILLILLLATS